MEIGERPVKELKIIVRKVLRELHENTDEQVREIWKTKQEQNEFNKEIDNTKKTQTEILKLKNERLIFLKNTHTNLSQSEII